MVEAGFKSDNHILMFPAGLNSRKIDGKIHDLEWKKTFITKSVEYQRDVVPYLLLVDAIQIGSIASLISVINTSRR